MKLMRNAARGLLCAAVALAALGATPALAAPHGGQAYYGGGGDNELRLEIGGASLSSGLACGVDPWGFTTCGYGFGYGAFVLGGDYDVRMSGPLHFTVGARLLAGPHPYASSLTFVEPNVGLTWKFGGFNAPIEPRLHLGAGLYLGPEIGAAFRVGGGIAFWATPRVAFGLDLMLDIGGLGGYGFTATQFTVGPEFRL